MQKAWSTVGCEKCFDKTQSDYNQEHPFELEEVQNTKFWEALICLHV
jgi:hypothetical protein